MDFKDYWKHSGEFAARELNKRYTSFIVTVVQFLLIYYFVAKRFKIIIKALVTLLYMFVHELIVSFFFQNVQLIKEAVESLQASTTESFRFLAEKMTSVEARITAVETAVCLVPLSIQPSSSTPIETLRFQPGLPALPSFISDNSANQSIPTSMSPQSSASTSFPLPMQMQNFTHLINTSTESTNNSTQLPLSSTPTRPPAPTNSISPLVSNLPLDKASRIKASRSKAKSRTKFTRICVEELFSHDELANSNTSGLGGKNKLDVVRVALVNRKYFFHSAYHYTNKGY